MGYPQGGYGYPRNGGYAYSPAFANGTNDGYEKGREDARDRDSYDPNRHKWFREGDHDYKSSYGARSQYENVYRQGFQEGYDRGYRRMELQTVVGSRQSTVVSRQSESSVELVIRLATRLRLD